MLHAAGVNPIFRVSRLCPVRTVQASLFRPLRRLKPLHQICLSGKKLTEQLCQLLHSVCQDFANESERGKFHAGMYRHGGIAGLRRNCHKFPSVIRAVNQFVAQHLAYNAFVVLDNVASPMHRDTMNAPVPNWVIPVGEFSQGGVWQQDPKGSVERQVQGKPTKGIIIDVSKPAPLHAASRFHQTEPWQGTGL